MTSGHVPKALITEIHIGETADRPPEPRAPATLFIFVIAFSYRMRRGKEPNVIRRRPVGFAAHITTQMEITLLREIMAGGGGFRSIRIPLREKSWRLNSTARRDLRPVVNMIFNITR